MITLMVQGTTSDAGKTTVVAALCRWLARQGVSVAPFKPQNMAPNSAITIDGGEVGRSTALQALACGIEPHSDMNPVLLKPHSDCGAQVILRGKLYGTMQALDYHAYKAEAMRSVIEAWQALSQRYDVIIAEGAGSPAEINLRANDIANMGFAEAVDCPVLLVGDIDRGGVFAQLVGTLDLLSASEQARIKGFVINRFRGDLGLLQPGLDWLTERTAKPVIGGLPYLQGLIIDSEDSIDSRNLGTTKQLKVIVPILPRISNHNDFDPLRLHPNVNLQFIAAEQTIPAADLIILPSSNSPCSDLAWLKAQGWQQAINKHLRYGGKLLGIGAGFQMLGEQLQDINADSSATGLGLLEISSQLLANQTPKLVQATLQLANTKLVVNGYLMGNGISQGAALARPLFTMAGEAEGAISEDQQIVGSYLHGLFNQPAVCDALLQWAGLENTSQAVDYQQHRLQQLDRLADQIEQQLDTQWLSNLLGLKTAAGAS